MLFILALYVISSNILIIKIISMSLMAQIQSLSDHLNYVIYTLLLAFASWYPKFVITSYTYTI